MEAARRALRSLDDAVFRVEQVILLVSLSMMTLLVGVDVVQRTFSRPVGRTASLLAALLGREAPNADDALARFVGPGVFAVISLAGFAFASWSAAAASAEKRGVEPPSFARSAAIGAVAWAGAALFVKIVLVVFPSSVPGAQKFALGFMLWSGMVGASLATRARRHIVIDAVTKKLDDRTARVFGLIAALLTFAFTAFVALLGVLQVKTQVADWMSGPGIGVYESLEVPYWTVTLAIPVAFGVTALRFLFMGVGDFVFGKPAVAGPDAHGVDLEALEKTTLDDGAA